MNPAVMRKLNGPYMRALRRIYGKPRFGDQGGPTDLQIRMSLGQPSIDCLRLKRRLMYMIRLSIHKPLALLALLSSVHNGRRMPWAIQASQDMHRFYGLSSIIQEALPPPDVDPKLWWEYLSSHSDLFKHAVSQILFCESCLDEKAQGSSSTSCVVHTHMCHLCPEPYPVFATHKALMQHRRAKHGEKNVMRHYANSDGVCPSCNTNFRTRLRLLSHLCDSRRGKCRNNILGGHFQRLPDDL
eukprot:11540318-Karenia_brevis.AAC.1